MIESFVNFGSHSYVLSTNWDLEKLPKFISDLDIEKVHHPNFRNESLAALYNSWRIPRLLKKYKCDVVFHPQPTSIAVGNVKNVTVIHDLYRVTHPHLYTLAERVQWRFVTAPAFLRSSHLIAVSDATRDSLIQAYGLLENEVTRIHEASPLEKPRVSPPEKFPGEPYALMVANFSPNKNVGLLASALTRLAKRRVFPKVVLVGRGDATELDVAVRAGARIVRLSNLSDDELTACYYHARVVINTSLVEGFCLPILEAHTLGVPVVCSDLRVLREVAGQGAIFINPSEPESLAAAIEAIFEQEELYAQYRSKALANAGRFSWKRAAREAEKVLEHIARPSAC